MNSAAASADDPSVNFDEEVNLSNRAAPLADFEKVNLRKRAAPPTEFETEDPPEEYHVDCSILGPPPEEFLMNIQTSVSGLRADFLSDATPDDSSPTAHLL